MDELGLHTTHPLRGLFQSIVPIAITTVKRIRKDAHGQTKVREFVICFEKDSFHLVPVGEFKIGRLACLEQMVRNYLRQICF